MLSKKKKKRKIQTLTVMEFEKGYRLKIYYRQIDCPNPKVFQIIIMLAFGVMDDGT